MSGWSDLKRIVSGKALTASPEVIEALHEGRAIFAIQRAVNRQIAYQVAAALEWGYSEFYRKSPAVRTVIDLIANNMAQLDLRLYEEIGTDEREERPDHPAMEALRYPNPAYASDQFVRFLAKSFLLYDNAFASKHRVPGSNSLQFVPLPPERIEIHGPGLVPTYYQVMNSDGTMSQVIPAEDMFHWRGEQFVDMRIGLSKLETLRSVVVEEAALAKTIEELAKSGMVEPMWIYRPDEAPDISAEGITRLEEHTANRLKNANRIPPLMEEGMELRGLGRVSPKDAEMLAVRKYALQQVASLYGVPLGMVGLDDNVEQAREEFYADTLPPICEAFCRQLNLQVLQEEYDETELYFDLDLDEKQMGNERLKALVSASGRAVMTTDEARAKVNLPKIETGDELVTPLNVIVGENPKPSPQVMGPQQPGQPSQEGDHRTENEPQTAAIRNGKGKALLLERHANIERRRDAAAKGFEAFWASFFERQHRSVKHKKPDVKAAVTEERWAQQAAADLAPLYQDFGTREGKRVARRIMSEFDGGQIKNYMHAKALKTAEALNEQTAKDIADYGVADAFDRAAVVRAPGIGKQAATDISAFATKEAVRQSGQPNRIVTIAGGECEHCGPYQGSWPIEDVPAWPGYHGNCTCIADVS